MRLFGRWWKKVLRYFMSEEEVFHEHPREENREKRIRYPTEESTVKVTHYYPKKGKFRFPIDVDDHPLRKEAEQPVDLKTTVAPSSLERDRKSNGNEKKRAYFQGKNFSYKPVPSPVFGYDERLPLQQHSLKKQTVQKIEEEVQIEEKENKESEERKTPATLAQESNDFVLHDETTFVQPVVEKNKKKSTTVRKSQKQQTEQENKKVTRIPYNVLMYPSDKKRQKERKQKEYAFPPLNLLKNPVIEREDDSAEIEKKREKLEATLHHFHVKATVVDVTKGPAITRFEVQPHPGVKVNKITNLSDDIKLALAVKDLRMEAPIPGKNAIGIEVPNDKSRPVFLKEILSHPSFQQSESPLTVAMGLDISGKPIVSDLKNMPHGLIAGATGSGKSVCLNAILISLLYKATPEEVRFILIDPKMVELASYKDIPHLVTPVIHDAKEATAALKWAVQEMESRYEKLAASGVRDIKRYNEKNPTENMPYIVIVIDELADLMMVSPQDVENAICRIAQKARACGIHLLVATQRPSVDVITGLIKANIPSRTAFLVSSQTDSRTILDMSGAERLIGKGDMLFHENGRAQPIRVQGAFVSDEEIEAVTDMVKSHQKPNYLFNREDLTKKLAQEQEDELFEEACLFVAEQGRASSSLLQRRFSIGYNRAAKLIDMMEARGIVSEAMGSKPRRVFMTKTEIEEKILHS